MTGLIELCVVSAIVLGLAFYDLAKTRKALREEDREDDPSQ
jgi:hypothetical protein